MLKDMNFCHLQEIFLTNLENKYWIQDQMLLKTASKKVVDKAAEATGEFIGNKASDKNGKQNSITDENSRNSEEIIIPPEKREKILNELK